MDERDDRASQRKGPRPDRAERLKAALRANLKRRKVQARGRTEPPDRATAAENHRNTSDSERKD
jgi:hypothetical protein